MDNTFRLNLGIFPSNNWKVNIAYAVSPTIQVSSNNLPSMSVYTTTAGSYRAVDIPERMFSVSNQSQNRFSMMQNKILLI